MSIQGIKLVTGEELVARVNDSIPSRFILVKDPLLLRVSAGPEGLVVNFFPWTIIADGEIEINRDTVVACYPVPKEVENNYIQNTTGLQIVSASSPKQLLKG